MTPVQPQQPNLIYLIYFSISHRGLEAHRLNWQCPYIRPSILPLSSLVSTQSTGRCDTCLALHSNYHLSGRIGNNICRKRISQSVSHLMTRLFAEQLDYTGSVKYIYICKAICFCLIVDAVLYHEPLKVITRKLQTFDMPSFQNRQVKSPKEHNIFLI